MRVLGITKPIYLVCLLLVCALMMSKGFGAYRVYDHTCDHSLDYAPWFSGPFISPTPVNVLPTEPTIQPFVTVGSVYGRYDDDWHFQNDANKWFINPLFDVQVGFTERVGLEVVVSFISKFKKGKSTTRLQDVNYFLGFQVANEDYKSWKPDIRIDLQGLLPTGSYQQLSSDLLGIDLTGAGSYQLGPLFIIHKVFHLGSHYLSLEASMGYLFASNVDVKGISAYSNNDQAQGTAHPGQTLTAYFTVECSITDQWAWGVDLSYAGQDRSTFSGNPGVDANGAVATAGVSATAQITAAPYIERTYSEHLGFFTGVWFSAGGRNSNAFASGFFALVYNF